MNIEGKYLSKNFYIANNTIFKTTGVSISWFSVVNDVKNIFSFTFKQAESVVSDWCLEQGVEPKEIYSNGVDYYGEIKHNEKEFIFPIKSFEHSISTHGEEYIEFGFKRQMINARLPEHELIIKIVRTDQEEGFINFIWDLPLQAINANSKFNLNVTHIKTGAKYVCDKTLLTSFNTNIDALHDEDDGYYGIDMNIALVFKPDQLKVEY